MLVETVLAILVVSVIASTAVTLFSSILFNLNVQKLATDLQMCEISKSGDHLSFDYEQKDEGDKTIGMMGPITESADVLAETLKKIRKKYSDCKFTVKDEEIDLANYGSKKVTGHFCIGPKKS